MTKPFRARRLTGSFLVALAAAVTAALFVAGPASASGNFTCPPNTGADVQSGINGGGTIYIHGTCVGNFVIDASDNAPNVTLIGLGVNPTLSGGGDGFSVLEIYGPANVTIKNLTLTNGDASVGFAGGGLSAFYACNVSDANCGSPVVNVFGSKIIHNTASEGGGVFAEDCAEINFTNSTISNNSATNGHGGGVLMNGVCGSLPLLSMTGTTVAQNTALDGGGGITLLSAQSAINGSTLANNTAQNGGGGGIESQFSNLQMSNTKLVSNLANDYGGGLDFGDSQGCGQPPCGNSGPKQGPNPPVIAAGLTISGSTIAHNTAVQYGGGGIENYADQGDSPATIMNSTIADNTAPGNELDGDSGGGGIHQDACDSNASMIILASKLYGNTAGNSMGGGIMNVAYCAGAADVTLAGTSLQNPNSLSFANQARWGGGIYNAMPNASVSLQAQTSIVKNKAIVTGGGVYNDCGGNLTIAPAVTLLLNKPNNIFNSLGCLIS